MEKSGEGKSMNTKKAKSKGKGILAPLVGAGLLFLSPFSKAQTDNIASVGLSSHHEQAYGRAGIESLPLTSNKRLSLQGEINYSGDKDQIKAKIGASYRRSPEGKQGFGANIYGFNSAKHNYLTFGGEYFTEDNQLFVNGYLGDFNGIEGGLVRDLFYNKNKTSTLRGLVGGYSFEGDSDESSGIRGGLRATIPLTRSNNWRLVGEGNVFSDPTFTGDWSASLSVQYGRPQGSRSVENIYLVEPVKETIQEEKPLDYSTIQSPSEQRPETRIDEDPENPDGELTGGGGSTNPVGNTGPSGGNGSTNPVGNN